jgi:spore coat polysaccharide biosynthesis predicted glycosyltransferase SpsG
MGGVDRDNFTLKILEELKNCDLPHDMEITVVIGESSPNIESIRAIIDEIPYKAKVRVDIDNMSEIMANADMAIGAAGATTWERCCLGLPTIQIVIAKNQEFSAKILENNNIVKLLTNIKDLAKLLASSSEWMNIVGNSAAKICNGTGTYRVISKLYK